MNTIETNIFPIVNLGELTTSYRSYRVRGLRRESHDYFKNRELIVRRLSFQLERPVEFYERGEDLLLAVPEGAADLPHSLMMVAAPVRFDPMEGVQELDYQRRDPATDGLCIRFLNSMVQRPLRSRLALWQPRAGAAFFRKQPTGVPGGVGRHEGFTVRAMFTENGGIGLCVDAKSCFVDRDPIPACIGRSEFRKLKGRHAVYRFGHQWFVVPLFERHDLNIAEYQFKLDGKLIPLAEYIETRSRKPIPPELANLDPAGSVLMYRNNRGEERSAPAALCYLTHDTESREVRSNHRQTIMPPDERRRTIQAIRDEYLANLTLGMAPVEVASAPTKIARSIFQIPDLLFGNGTILSVAGNVGARSVSLSNLGRVRSDTLLASTGGFFVRSALHRQYLFLPRSVADGWGEQFVADLRRSVDALYPHGGYDPQLVEYNDVGVGRTFVDQAKAILAAARANCVWAGFAVVMIHELQRGRRHSHDQLEAAVLREFPKLSPGIRAAVIHSAKGNECYEQFSDLVGNPAYRIRADRKPVFSGYLRNVALSKVLLTNEKWPFVLAKPLQADLTIGIDVKHHTVGYAVISSAGRSIRFLCEPSRQKEKLLASQIRTHLEDIIRAEFDDQGRSIGSIVIHRDGRVFPEECAGAEEAMVALRSAGVLRSDATLSILELSKTGPSALRLFELRQGNGPGPFAVNPPIGLHRVVGHDAWLATTGWPFIRPGTARPLHVRYVRGGLPFEACLEDVFHLSILTWSRPEDCARLPITIKLIDRALGEDATEYDEDALRFAASEARATA